MHGKYFLAVLIILVVGVGTYFFLNNRTSQTVHEKEEEEIDKDKEVREDFNPSLLKWEKVEKDIPWLPRDAHTVIAFKDKLWLIGGLNANDQVTASGAVHYEIAPHFSDIWVSADGIDWEIVTEDAPWGKRRSLQSVVFKDKIWLIPGWGPETGLRSEVWSSDNGKDWENVVSAGNWPVREGHQLVVFNDKLWLIGGVNYGKRETKNDVWYSEDGTEWSNAVDTAPWPSRWDHEVISFNNKLWLIGGMDLNGTVYGDVWSSEDGKNWTLVTENPPWKARQGHELVVFKDLLWIVGRFDSKSQGGGVNDVWFSKDGQNWEKTDIDPHWPGREDHSVLVFKDKIWVLGGMSSEWVWLNDVWYSTSP